MPRDVVSENVLTGNFDDNIAFITNFITTYTGAAANVPATCFNVDVQNTLNANLGAMMLDIATGKIGNALTQLGQFLENLVQAELACGLQFLPQNLATDIQTKGTFYLLVNAVHNLPAIQTAFYSTTGFINTNQWGQAGTAFGTLVGLIIPLPTSSATLSATPKETYAFFQGLIDGLEGTTSTPGVCYQAFMTAQTEFSKVSQALKVYKHEGSIMNLIGLGAAIQNYAPYITTVTTQCAWGSLETQILSIFDGGLKALLMQYYKNPQIINADFENVKACATNYNLCGKSLGEMVRILFTWSLNSEVLASEPNTKWENIVSFSSGLLKGLEGSVQTPGKCYSTLSTAGTTFVAIVAEANQFLGGDHTALTPLAADATDFLPEFSAIDCNFGSFIDAVDVYFKPNGYKKFFTTYYNNLKVVDADIYHVIHCAQDYTVCGSSLGNAVNLMFNWSLA